MSIKSEFNEPISTTRRAAMRASDDSTSIYLNKRRSVLVLGINTIAPRLGTVQRKQNDHYRQKWTADEIPTEEHIAKKEG